jgi:hypothetical protein
VELSTIVEDQNVFSNAEVDRPYKVPISNMTLSKEFVYIHDLATLGDNQDSPAITKPNAITDGYTDPMKDT